MEIPTKITKDEDKVKFLYRAIELLRLEHNEMGRKFREKEITEKEWEDYVMNDFRPRSAKLFEMLNPIKEKLGMFQIDPKTDPDNPNLKLKEDGKKESKWDEDINIKQI